MRKPKLTALIASGLIISASVLAPMAAFADDDEDEGVETSEVENDRRHNETDRKHREINEVYGETDHLSVPPLVIRPQKPGDHEAPKPIATPDSIATSVPVDPSITTQGAGGRSDFVLSNPQTDPLVAGSPGKPGLASELATAIDPLQNAPIDVKKVQSGTKTPAEVFIASATNGVIAMGIGAVALGVVASTRAIRRR
jgi:hypothetical protein